MAMHQLQQVQHVHSPGWFLVETRKEKKKKKRDFENGSCLHFTLSVLPKNLLMLDFNTLKYHIENNFFTAT